MKVLALVYPGMTLLDLVGPIQAWSFLPGYEVQFAWRHTGRVTTDCGLSVESTHTFEDAWSDPHVLMVGGGAKPTLDLLADSAAIRFLADRGSRARWVCSVCTGALLLGAAGLLRGYRAAVHWGARDALSQFGAEPSDERVCIDRNRLTGAGITAGVDFGIAVAVAISLQATAIGVGATGAVSFNEIDNIVAATIANRRPVPMPLANMLSILLKINPVMGVLRGVAPDMRRGTGPLHTRPSSAWRGPLPTAGNGSLETDYGPVRIRRLTACAGDITGASQLAVYASAPALTRTAMPPAGDHLPESKR